MRTITRRALVALFAAGAMATLCGCASPSKGAMREVAIRKGGQTATSATAGQSSSQNPEPSSGDGVSVGTLQEGSVHERGFVVDDVLRDTAVGDVHFSLHVPDSYDGSRPFALYVHCPGWEGLLFQGLGAHLVEDFAFVANDHVPDMIVATPQLDDWGDTSARKTIAPTEWLVGAFNIDADRVYLSGYSGGGETVSIVLGMRPKLYRRALHASSRWDGDVGTLVSARVPVRIAIGEADDYYGSGPAREAYADIRDAYLAAGASEKEIDELVVLDVRDAAYFEDKGQTDQHAAGATLFPHDDEIMEWLFTSG